MENRAYAILISILSIKFFTCIWPPQSWFYGYKTILEKYPVQGTSI